MKWLAVFLVVLVVAVACGDVVESDSNLEARVEALEKALSSEPFMAQGQKLHLIDVWGLKHQVDSLEDRVFYLEMGWQ